MENNIEGKVVVITGASSGIGEATALLLAERGAKVVLGARGLDRLETCMMDVEAHHECSIKDTMVEILAIESRRHFDGKPNIYSSGLRCVFGTGRGQAKHLGDLY